MSSSPPVPPVADALTSNELSALRTGMAADRTLMAWVRTSLSMLSFGFTIYKVLEGFVAEGRHISPNLPQNAGLTLAFAGTLAMILGIAEYIGTWRHLGLAGNQMFKRFTLLMAVLMCTTGIVLFLGIATHLI